MKSLVALTILLGSALAGADPQSVSGSIAVDESELAALDHATSDSAAEPVGRHIDTDAPVVAKLGLKVGDTIRAVDGSPALSINGMFTHRSAVVYLDALHDGKPVVLRLVVKPDTTPTEPLDLDDLDLARFTATTKAGKPSGVLVNSYMRMGGLALGDIIRSVDGKAIATPAELQTVLKAAFAAKKDVTFAIDRLDVTFKITTPVVDSSSSKLAELVAKGIKKIDDTHYEIKKAVVDEILANPMAVAKGARVVPSMKDGKANGFKLYAIRPSSLYAAIGLSNGDTITTINGMEITSADKALEVYTKLREAKKLEIVLERRGQKLTLTYTIK